MREIKNIKESPLLRSFKDDNSFDLIACFSILKYRWRRIVGITVGGIVIAFATAIFYPDEYTSTAKLLPLSSDEPLDMGGLSSLAGLAGFDIGGVSTSISPELYPQIVNSYPFLNKFVNKVYSYSDVESNTSLYDYLMIDTIPTIGATLINYSIKLPWTIKDKITGKKEAIQLNRDAKFSSLSELEYELFEKAKELLGVSFNPATGVVTVAGRAEEPLVAAEYAQFAFEELQDYIIRFKVKQAQESLNVIAKNCQEKKTEYEISRKRLFDYMDSHRNIVNERQGFEYQSLKDDYEIKASVYREMANHLEQAKVKVSQSTPAFEVIEPVTVPVKKSSPRKLVILFAISSIGFILAVASVYFERFLLQLRIALHERG